MKKKVLATLLVGAMAASLLAGCGTTVETTGSSDTTTAPEKTQTTETAEAGEAGGSDVSADITLWTYPIGEWGNAETVDSLIQDFNKEYPGINVTVEHLDYTNGDDQVNTASIALKKSSVVHVWFSASTYCIASAASNTVLLIAIQCAVIQSGYS